MVALLAALSASAAGGMRVALPLLMIGLVSQTSLWQGVPILSQLNSQVVLGVLVSWSLCELILAKSLIGQRWQQSVQLVFSPIAGCLLGIAVVRQFDVESELAGWVVALIGVVGGLLALVIQLVQAGWVFRLKRLPLWVALLEDALCVCLVFFAFDAPQQGGIVALLLLWLALRSSAMWRRWYAQQQSTKASLAKARQGKLEPD